MKGISFVVLFEDNPEKDLFFSFTKGVTDVKVEGTSNNKKNLNHE